MNILRLTIGVKDCILFVFMQRAHACDARVRESTWFSIVYLWNDSLQICGEHTNYYKLHQLAWATYFSCSLTARTRSSAGVRARSLLTHSLMFGQILFKFAGNIIQWITSYKGYILIMFTHRGHARERACARAYVIEHSFIYGPILFKFSSITPSSMGYVLFMFTHRTHACECGRASARVVKTFSYLWTDSLQICWTHITNDHKLHGLYTYLHV
jgi:hypothetical protein